MEKTIINKAIKHLSKDVRMNALILKFDKPKFNYSSNPFYALTKYIIFQQLSGKSANAIYQRFIKIYNGTISANSVLKTEDKKIILINEYHNKDGKLEDRKTTTFRCVFHDVLYCIF